MTPENFCYWLQGFLEIGDVKQFDEIQVSIVKEHLQLVFTKVTSGGGSGGGIEPPWEETIKQQPIIPTKRVVTCSSGIGTRHVSTSFC